MIVLIALRANVAPHVPSDRPFTAPREAEAPLIRTANAALNCRQNEDKKAQVDRGPLSMLRTCLRSSRCCRGNSSDCMRKYGAGTGGRTRIIRITNVRA